MGAAQTEDEGFGACGVARAVGRYCLGGAAGCGGGGAGGGGVKGWGVEGGI